jgi:hypothetical protein
VIAGHLSLREPLMTEEENPRVARESEATGALVSTRVPERALAARDRSLPSHRCVTRDRAGQPRGLEITPGLENQQNRRKTFIDGDAEGTVTIPGCADQQVYVRWGRFVGTRGRESKHD